MCQWKPLPAQWKDAELNLQGRDPSFLLSSASGQDVPLVPIDEFEASVEDNEPS